MNFTIEVNHKQISARKGETILDALNRNGIKVPTLCHLPGLNASGACRMCVVEVEGKPSLITACSYPVEEWMRIQTHSPRVVKARKTLVELLLANHPDDCLYCVRNCSCELQNLAVELNVRERRFSGKKTQHRLDQSCVSLVRDPAKCILCGRCIRVCNELVGVSTFDFLKRGKYASIGPAFEKPLNLSNCITCGQCIMVCPTGALHEKEVFTSVQEMLHRKDLYPVIQLSPSVVSSLSEEFGLKPGKDIQGILNSALRKIGFKKVFDSGFGADLHIMEAADELLDRISKNENLPMFTSDCPAWVKYAEEYLPDSLNLLCTIRSPQQLTGRLIKSYFAEIEQIKPENIYSVSVMPCTAKKFEAVRDDLAWHGINDVDAVITTRELAKLFKLNGVDFLQGEPEHYDQPLAIKSSAARLFGVSGGVAEAILRSFYFKATGEEMSSYKITKLRGSKFKKEIIFQAGNYQLGIAVVSGMVALKHLLKEISSGKKDIQLIEVMACPGGCVNGGGQPFTQDENTINQRIKTIYESDEKESVKSAHKNPGLFDLYNKYLDQCKSGAEGEGLKASYQSRSVLL